MYWRRCERTVKMPEDYPDGSCKTKDDLRKEAEQSIEKNKEKKDM